VAPPYEEHQGQATVTGPTYPCLFTDSIWSTFQDERPHLPRPLHLTDSLAHIPSLCTYHAHPPPPLTVSFAHRSKGTSFLGVLMTQGKHARTSWAVTVKL